MATPENRMIAALRVVSAREQGFDPVVVVSAIGRRGAPYATDTLITMLRDTDPSVEPNARELDLMMACGEILSSVVFAHTLKTLGHQAQAFRGGQAGIRTDGVFGSARILGIKPVALIKSIREGNIPVVCGFQGVWVEGDMPGAELTTLGRGGSDTTAAALGAAMRAESVEIFTDVDGVKTADPDSVKDAPTLRRVTYPEVAEIAHLGAKVLHPRAAEIAMRFGIPLWVKNTFSEDEGTEVVPQNSLPGRRVTGVTHAGKLVHISFDLRSVAEEDRSKFESRVYAMMAKHAINLFMINLSPSGMGFAVTREQYPMVPELLDGLVIPLDAPSKPMYFVHVGDKPSPQAEIQRTLLEGFVETRTVHVSVNEGCTMVSLIGHEYMQQPGVFYDVLSTLHEAQIPVHQISDSDFSISCLIPESELNRAVRLLHDRFDLRQLR